MGEVAQRVAIKLLRPGADSIRSRERFLAERQILANLSHPHIAKLLDAGHREDGQPYLVMEYIDGKTIDVFTAELSIRLEGYCIPQSMRGGQLSASKPGRASGFEASEHSCYGGG